jgi:hypothetical protein
MRRLLWRHASRVVRVVETAIRGGDGGCGDQKWNASIGKIGRERSEKKMSGAVSKSASVHQLPCH